MMPEYQRLAEPGDPLDMLVPLSEEELGIEFDELAEIAASQPDDEIALVSLRRLVLSAHESGQVAAAMQMAMTLGAMACVHPHMEALAESVGESLSQSYGSRPDETSEVSAGTDKTGKTKDKKKKKKEEKKKPASPFWRQASPARREGQRTGQAGAIKLRQLFQ